jgi:hypothetical protein
LFAAFIGAAIEHKKQRMRPVLSAAPAEEVQRPTALRAAPQATA